MESPPFFRTLENVLILWVQMLKSLDYRAGSLSWAADQGDSPAVRDTPRRCICLESVKKESSYGERKHKCILDCGKWKMF